MRVTYQSPAYTAERVIARYVRAIGSGQFKVFEVANDGPPGCRRPTIREYETDGAEIPELLRVSAVTNRPQNLRWF